MFNPLNIFNRKKRKNLEFNLDSCVAVGLLTQEECLRLKKDRAIAMWKSEVGRESARKRKARAKEVIYEPDDEIEEVEE